MRGVWKWVGLAGVAGVVAGGDGVEAEGGGACREDMFPKVLQ